MSAKKPPTRTCSGCGVKGEKSRFVRVVRSPEGSISLDVTGRKNGRGAYLCPEAECLKKARKTRRISRSLKCEIPDEIYTQMEEMLKGAKQ
jgi:predicted RNA-binding protein YlxR (DUF448 family)